MKKLKIIIILLLITTGLLVSLNFVLAGSTFYDGIKGVGTAVTYFDTAQATPITYIANVVKFLLSFVGVVFIGLILYSGYTYMTSGGNEDKIKKATNTIKSTSVGLLLIIMGYSITTLVTLQYTTGGSGELGTYDSPSDIWGTGYDNVAYNASCEDSGDPIYYDIICCDYRMAVFGTASPECCVQTSFAENLGGDCSNYCSSDYCQGDLATLLSDANSLCGTRGGSATNLRDWSNQCQGFTSAVYADLNDSRLTGGCELNIGLSDPIPTQGVKCVWR